MTTKSEDDYWEKLAYIWARATGGSNVAAGPGNWSNSTNAQLAPPAPGSEEVVLWALSSGQDKSVPRMTFLVGGPGNGKSELASRVVAGLKPIDKDIGLLARRSYSYSLEEKDLLFINDASIGLRGIANASLASEIDKCVSTGSNLIANINRGIIYEELNASPSIISNLVLSWLAQSETKVGRFQSESEYALVPLISKDFLATAEISNNGIVVARLAVCFMDACSLMESQPIVEVLESGDAQFEFRSTEYKITRFSKRCLLPELDQTPSAILLRNIVDGLRSTYPYDTETIGRFDPIFANLQSLNFPEVQRNFLSILRGGEIAASRLMTYRELWGAIARIILGTLPERSNIDKVKAYLFDREQQDADPLDRFNSFRNRADLRGFQALYGELDPRLSHIVAAEEPVTRLTRKIDPIKDASPDWASSVMDAFSMSSAESSPLQNMRQALQTNADDARVFEMCVSAFDEELDERFQKAISSDSMKDHERNRISGWYGRYLTRFLAFVTGKVAFESEIDQWTQTWVREDLSPDLLTSLTTLLLPTGNSDENVLFIPIYSSRTEPVLGEVTKPELVLKVTKDWKLKPRRQGESLFVQLIEERERIVDFQLDFALMREALACRQGHLGVTEYIQSTSPRIERFRAALLLPTSGKAKMYWLLHPVNSGERIYYD